jgi:hypothetical protein
MSEETDQKFGLAGNEQAQGYEPLSVANPVDTPEPETMTEHELSHFNRPEPPAPIEREYQDVNTGEEIPANKTVSAEQAASDIQRVRDAERQAREAQSNRDLVDALNQTQPKLYEAQPAQTSEQTDIQPQAENFETMNSDAARSEVDAAWQKADEQITEFLKDPHIRERIQGEYDQIKTTAAAEAKAEVERAYNLSAAAQQHYATATSNLVGEANALLGVLYPELNGLNPEQIKGALAVMAQQQPQRVQQLQTLAARAQGLVEAQARQQHEAVQAQALQRDAALEQYTSANVQEYEKWSAKENPGTMKAVRENLKPTVEKYGVPFETLMAIHTGKMQMDATTFVRSAAFQKMLHDSIKYNLATRGVTEARSNPIPRVQRPGVASDGPRVHDGDLAAASARFNLPGGNEGTQGLKNAAAWITARRGR